MENQLALLALAVVALTAILGLIWFARARAGRRLRAVLDAYVEREQAKTAYSTRDS